MLLITHNTSLFYPKRKEKVTPTQITTANEDNKGKFMCLNKREKNREMTE